MKVDDIKKDVMNKMPNAVKSVQERVYGVCTEFLNVFYGEYEPHVAKRTHQVFNSLVKSDVRKCGNGYESDVYFDLSALHHPSSYIGKDGSVVRRKWSEPEILESVMVGGSHGGTYRGIRVFTESDVVVSAKAEQWLKQALIAAGVPIR